jgi:hypothetical protein
MHDGQVNDLLITKTAKYTDVYTIPTKRFTNTLGAAGYHFDQNLKDALGGKDSTGDTDITYAAGNFPNVAVTDLYVKNSSGDETRLSGWNREDVFDSP